MAAIDFPSSPSNGDTHTVGGVTYTYNSAETKWKTTINSNAFLPLSGGTVTGTLTVNDDLAVDTDTLFVDVSTDQVGIGTSNPQASLHIGNGSGNGVEIGNNGTLQVIDRGNSRIEPLTVTAEYAAFSIARNTSTTLHDERARITYDGLTFNGDTAAANALDDYEEGTWTPTIVWSGGSTSVTYNHQKGGYVKIGNVVHFYGYLALSNFSGASGNAKLSNFPFAAKNQTLYYHAPAIGWYSGLATTSYGLGLDIAPNSTSHTIVRGTGTTITGLNPSDINSNFSLEWAFTVHVN